MMTLSEFFDAKYRPLRLTASPWKSISVYRDAIRQVQRTAGRDISLDELTDELLATMVSRTLDRGCSRNTAANHLRHVACIWSFARRLGVVNSSPQIAPIKAAESLPQAWTPEEVGRILGECRRQTGDVGPVSARLFWPAIVLFFYDTGARRTVTLSLSPARFDLDRRLVRLPATRQKQLREQVSMLSPQTVAAIEDIWDANRQWVFCWPYDRGPRATGTAILRRFKGIVRAAGVDAENGLFHRLRRTRATLGEIVEPGSATADLGHSSRAVTVKHYIDNTKLPVSSVVDRLPRPVEPTPTLRVVS